MLEKIKQRVAACKKVFTCDQKNLNENSSWQEILMTRQFSVSEFKKLNWSIVKKHLLSDENNCDYREIFDILQKSHDEYDKFVTEDVVFSQEEKHFLASLPGYTRIINWAYDLRNDLLRFGSIKIDKDHTFYWRAKKYGKYGDVYDDAVIIDGTIVTKNNIALDCEVCEFIVDLDEVRFLLVRYAHDIPEEWLAAKQAWERRMDRHLNLYDED